MNIICDLDGTIALDHGRAHHLHGTDCPKRSTSGALNPHAYSCTCTSDQRDWNSYFAACDTDEICVPVRAIMNGIQGLIGRVNIYILSGRSMSVYEKTIKWLGNNRVPYDFLQMRSIDDRTDDHELKLRWAKDLLLTPENTLFVLEDRDRVVAAWRAKGFRCFQVAPGNF